MYSTPSNLGGTKSQNLNANKVTAKQVCACAVDAKSAHVCDLKADSASVDKLALDKLDVCDIYAKRARIDEFTIVGAEDETTNRSRAFGSNTNNCTQITSESVRTRRNTNTWMKCGHDSDSDTSGDDYPPLPPSDCKFEPPLSRPNRVARFNIPARFKKRTLFCDKAQFNSDVCVNGDIELSGKTTLTDGLCVEGDVNVSGKTTLANGLCVEGGASVAGKTSFEDDLCVNGTADFQDRAVFCETATFKNGLCVEGFLKGPCERRIALELPEKYSEPRVITEPGHYCLTNNSVYCSQGFDYFFDAQNELVVTSSDPAIVIASSDVILDFNGYTLTVERADDAPADRPFPETAVLLAQQLSNVLVTNGTIRAGDNWIPVFSPYVPPSTQYETVSQNTGRTIFAPTTLLGWLEADVPSTWFNIHVLKMTLDCNNATQSAYILVGREDLSGTESQCLSVSHCKLLNTLAPSAVGGCDLTLVSARDIRVHHNFFTIQPPTSQIDLRSLNADVLDIVRFSDEVGFITDVCVHDNVMDYVFAGRGISCVGLRNANITDNKISWGLQTDRAWLMDGSFPFVFEQSNAIELQGCVGGNVARNDISMSEPDNSGINVIQFSIRWVGVFLGNTSGTKIDRNTISMLFRVADALEDSVRPFEFDGIYTFNAGVSVYDIELTDNLVSGSTSLSNEPIGFQDGRLAIRESYGIWVRTFDEINNVRITGGVVSLPEFLGSGNGFIRPTQTISAINLEAGPVAEVLIDNVQARGGLAALFSTAFTLRNLRIVNSTLYGRERCIFISAQSVEGATIRENSISSSGTFLSDVFSIVDLFNGLLIDVSDNHVFTTTEFINANFVKNAGVRVRIDPFAFNTTELKPISIRNNTIDNWDLIVENLGAGVVQENRITKGNLSLINCLKLIVCENKLPFGNVSENNIDPFSGGNMLIDNVELGTSIPKAFPDFTSPSPCPGQETLFEVTQSQFNDVGGQPGILTFRVNGVDYQATDNQNFFTIDFVYNDNQVYFGGNLLEPSGFFFDRETCYQITNATGTILPPPVIARTESGGGSFTEGFVEQPGDSTWFWVNRT